MIVFRTEVFYVPASPLGLVGDRWAVQHRCNACHRHVPGDQLVNHARSHGDDHRRGCLTATRHDAIIPSRH